MLFKNVIISVVLEDLLLYPTNISADHKRLHMLPFWDFKEDN